MKKGLLSLGALGLISLTLVSCSSSVNTSVAYGGLSDNVEYASSNGNSLSQKKLYDLMRSDAYSTVANNIKKQLFSDVLPKYKDGALTNTKYFNYDQSSTDEDVLEDTYKVNSNVVSRIYGASSVDSFKALTAKDKETAARKAVDSLMNAGVTKADGNYFTYADLTSLPISFAVDANGDDVFVIDSLPYELYETYIYDIALQNYALEQLKNPEFDYYYKNKYVPGSGTNSYYVEDDDVQDFYYSTGKNYRNYSGIIIEFTSSAQARRIMNAAIGSTKISSDPATALSQYVQIYNTRYVTRDDIATDTIGEDNYTNLSITYKKNRLGNYDSSIQTIFKEMEDGKYFDEAFDASGKYYLVYRNSGEDVVEWANLDEDQKKPGENGAETVYDEMLEYVLENKSITSLVSIIENDRMDSLVDDIEFYDPLFAVKYDTDHSDYNLTKTFDNKYVYKFTYNDAEYTLTPEELYEKLEPQYGTTTSIDYLKDKWLLSLDGVKSLIDSDDFDDINDSLKSELKAFKKGKKSYSSKLGNATYLQLTYGYSTKDEVYEAKAADLIEARLSSFFGDYSSLGDTTKANVSATLFQNFATIYKNLYEEYFSASISHILIGVDETNTQNFTNPDAYYEKLSATAQVKFKETIYNIVNAIISEVKALTKSLSVADALTYIVDAYNNNYLIGSLSYGGPEVYWNDLKNEFPISMKAEDLGEVDLFSAANYMEEFSERVKELWDKVQDDIIPSENVTEDKGVFEFDTEFTSVDDMFDAICKTSYGYHILNIYDTDEAATALFEESSDEYASIDDEYMIYEHLEVVIIPDDGNGSSDDDDDPEYVLYTNGYSSNAYASASQLFVYFYEEIVVGTHSLLKSSVKTAIAEMFGGALSFYTNSSFQNWTILKYQMSDLTFSRDNQLSQYMLYLENSLYSYATTKYTLYTDYIDGTYNWALDYNWNR